MASNNFSDIKGTLLEAFSMVTDKVLDLADVAADTARSGQQAARLVMEKHREESAVKSAYEQLGQQFYEQSSRCADGPLAEVCGQITRSLERIAEINDELGVLKQTMSDPVADIEVELRELFGGEDGDDEGSSIGDADFERVVDEAQEGAAQEGGEAP